MSNAEEAHTTDEVQRKKWIETRQSIDKIIKRLTTSNIQSSVLELFTSNIKRSRGLLVRSIMQHQLHLPQKTPTYASLIDVLNSKIGSIGKLISSRVILQFKMAYISNDYQLSTTSLQFLSYLTMHQVISEITMLQVIQLLLESPVTDGDVELCVDIFKVAGKFLLLSFKVPTTVILNRVKDLLQDDQEKLGSRAQSSLRYLFRLGQLQFKSIPMIEKSLDLINDEDKQTHVIDLQDKVTSKDYLNVYQFDNDYDKHEEEYDALRQEILDGDEGEEETVPSSKEVTTAKPVEIVSDMAQSDLLQYQKQVYLTVMSSMSSEEAVHKLLKLSRQQSQSQQQNSQTLCDMIIKCCSQEKTYSKYFGVIGEILCGKNHHWQTHFINLFKHYYSIIDNFEANALRNIGKFFGHLFASDVIPLDRVWDEVRITQQDTDPAKRILLKFIFQEMVEEMGVNELKARLVDDAFVKRGLKGVFPVVDVDEDDAEHLRFSINFFTAIGLGVLTEEMRHVLNNLPPARSTRGRRRSRDSGSGSSSSRGSSYSGSYSSNRSRSGRSGSYSRSRSFSRSRSNSYSGSRSRTPSRESFCRSSSGEDGRRKSSIEKTGRSVKRRRSLSSSSSEDEKQKPKLSDILKQMH